MTQYLTQTIFVVTADPVVDYTAEMIDAGFVAGAFTSLEAAKTYVETIRENNLRKRWHYAINKVELQTEREGR